MNSTGPISEANPPAAAAGRLLFVLVLASGILAFANSFSGAFLFDDFPHIVNSLQIRDAREAVRGSTRPLVQLTLHWNYLIGGVNPADYHLVNLAVHLLAALFLYGLVRRTLLLPAFAGRYDRSAAAVGAAVACLWVAHPLQTESVTYIIQRAESMMGMFYLAVLYCFARAAGAASPRGWLAAAVTACAAGMACKPVMVTAPLMVLLYDRQWVAGSFRGALRARKGFYLFLAGTWAIVIALLVHPNESTATAGFGATMQVSELTYLRSQPAVILHYLRLVVWPAGQSLDYGWVPASAGAAAWLPSLAVLALLLLSIRGCTGGRSVGFPGLWLLVTLAPSSSFIPVADLAVEHRMYLALAGPIVALVLAGDAAAHALARRAGGRGASVAWCAVVAAAVLALSLIAVTRQRNEAYSSELNMWRDVAAKCPANLRARSSLVGALLAEEQYAEAERLARALLLDIQDVVRGRSSLRTAPGHAAMLFTGVLNQLGRALLGQHREDDAAAQFRAAIAAGPSEAPAYHNLALVLKLQGRDDEALELLSRVLAAHPVLGRSHVLAGEIMEERGRYGAALGHYRSAVAEEPRFLPGTRRLARLLAACPQAEIRDGQEALRLALALVRDTGGASYRALDTLAAAYAETGDFAGAVRVQSEALAAAERFAEAGSSARGVGKDAGDGGELEPTIEELRARFELYKARKPFRLSPR